MQGLSYALILDARSIPQNELVETDVCIVGAGAAGITLAREFINQPFRVCLLESGGLDFDPETQSLYDGKIVGLPYFPLDACRLRYFGGTTNHWAGWCVPLDEIDFEERHWIPHSGWPIRKSDLIAHYGRAQLLCGVGTHDYEVDTWEDSQDARRFLLNANKMVTKINLAPGPVPGALNFGRVYRDEITRAWNISAFLYGNVVDIETTYTANRVTRLRVACLSGKSFWVSARVFILAAGAIENARLLLFSRQVQQIGLGNQKDLVGRFFMEHLELNAGILLPSDPYIPAGLYTHRTMKGKGVHGALALAPEIQHREGLLNCKVALEPHFYNESAAAEGIGSFKYFYRSLRQRKLPDDFWKHLQNVIADLDVVAVHTYRRIIKGQSPFILFAVRTHSEPVPNPDSRVTLAPERDQLGKNLVQLEWRLTELDKRSMRRTLEILGAELGRAGLGRVRVLLDDSNEPWQPPASDSPWTGPTGAYHHMGTTRMHSDPRRGVVDANCRVHGITNLFVSGSSVFPTAGNANPTLTIVALALRLANHIKEIMKS